ncbi:MAG: hypothetical protein AAF282_03385 [Cyanobacteria bacterium P01_A01_bin.15]
MNMGNNFLKDIPWWVKSSFSFLFIVLGVSGYDYLTQNSVFQYENATDFLSQQENLQKVQITVRDRVSQEPIENVSLDFIIDGPSVEKVTDRKGYVELEMPPRDSVEVTFNKSDYELTRETINLTTDPNATRVIYLDPKAP